MAKAAGGSSKARRRFAFEVVGFAWLSFIGMRRHESDWITTINGAIVWQDLFVDISNTRVHYEKVSHGLKITEWLIQNEPSAIQDVAHLLVGILTHPG
jgi:hypothetical protein